MEFLKDVFFFIWDLVIYLIKSILYLLLVMIIVCAVEGEGSEIPFYVLLVSIPICLYVCWKPFKRKRLKRQLAKSNKEIARLEKEIADLNAQKQQIMFDSISFIDHMEGHEFEHWCAALLLKIGFDSADVTQASGDDGVDIVAIKEGIRYAIQCKCYSSDLGNKPIQEVHAGKDVYRCHIGAVMTNVHFTAGGKRVAEATGTLLWDRTWIADKIAKINGTSPVTAEPSPDDSGDIMEYIHKVQWYSAAKDRE